MRKISEVAEAHILRRSGHPKTPKRRKPLIYQESSNHPVFSPISRLFRDVGENWGRTKAWLHLSLARLRGENHMTKKETEYKEIKRKYPKTMSKDQFYQIAHISKATALFLLKNGLVPCVDSGKKTRRYTIQTDDVIEYLKDRDAHPDSYKAIRGWYSGTAGKKEPSIEYIAPRLSPDQQKLLVQYLSRLMKSYDDLMTVKQLAGFSGYNTTTIINWCNKSLKHFNIAGRFLIPKISALEYLASPQLCSLPQKSKKHKELLTDFLSLNGITG